jgi:Cys-tRNA(Pro) deacylase
VPDRIAPAVTATEALLDYLAEHECPATLVTPGVPMPTVPLAAAAIGVQEEQILKSLLFTSGDGGAVLAIAAGTGKVNRTRLAALIGAKKLSLANPDTVLRLTGCPVGGVAPVGHPVPVPVVIDQRVMDLEVAFGGGGAEDVLLKITPADIQRLTGATVADIADAGT